jgi:two-component system cell cycle response regulator DivK
MSTTQTAAEGTRTLPAIKPGDATILVVEDTVSNFILIVRMLSFMGVQHCEWKPSGWQVVPFASTLPAVHLILLDLRLPYENGYGVLKKIRANTRLKDTIVCAVTAQVGDDEVIQAQKAGFDGFLGKPLDPDRFPDQIRRLLAREHVWEWK